MNETQTGMRVSAAGIAVNLLLSLYKLIAGILSASTAMITDAIHSASDVFSTVIVMIGMKISARAIDREHPYGHERFECAAAVILSAMLFFTGALIGYDSLKTLISGEWQEKTAPGVGAAIAAGVSIAVKEAMFRVTKHYAKKIDSPALLADAWHHRSDALSSVGALLGIFFARRGFLFMDAAAGLLICLMILKAAADIFIDAMNKMVDKAADPEKEKEIAEFIREQDHVTALDALRTRCFGNRIYVDAEIALPPDMSLREAHGIAEQVHDGIEEKFGNVKHVMIHVNPAEK